MKGGGGGGGGRDRGANAKLMPFPDITESAEISPLPRRQEVCFISPPERDGDGGRRVLKGGCG